MTHKSLKCVMIFEPRKCPYICNLRWKTILMNYMAFGFSYHLLSKQKKIPELSYFWFIVYERSRSNLIHFAAILLFQKKMPIFGSPLSNWLNYIFFLSYSLLAQSICYNKILDFFLYIWVGRKEELGLSVASRKPILLNSFVYQFTNCVMWYFCGETK